MLEMRERTTEGVAWVCAWYPGWRRHHLLREAGKGRADGQWGAGKEVMRLGGC